eukprot:gene9302-1390_t
MSKIQFTPLSGAYNEDPLCYVLEIDDFCILLDCGWDDNFDVNSPHIKQLTKYIDKIQLVLLSHCDIAHSGALPYAYGKLGLKAEIFATLPIMKMGQMHLYDAYQNRYEQEEFEVFNLDDVDSAFDGIKPLKYSQKHVVEDENGEEIITIVPFPAGHSLGGTIWKIIKENEEIVYAVDWNNRLEGHLNPCALSSIGKPSILITDSYNSLCNTEFKDTKTKFIDSVTKTLRKGGDIIIPSDAASRVFELLHVLETFWRENKSFQIYKIYFLSSMSFRTIEFASHQLEWMSENIVKSFDEKRENPFQFKHIQLIHHIDELKKNNHPVVIISPSETLQCGFSRELFTKKCSDRKNLILLTEKPKEDTLPYKILNQNKITIKLKKRVPLEGEELDDFEYKRRLLKEAEKKKKRDDEARKKVIEIRDEEDSDDEETETLNNPRLFLPENLRYHSQFLMFPCVEKSYQFDEYGQMIDVEELESRTSQFIENDEKYQEEEEEIIMGQEIEEDFIPPTKCIEETHHCLKNCEVKVIEYEGRSNSLSIKNILSSIKPRKLILIHGSKPATNDLLDYCQKKKVSDICEAPKLLETVEFIMDTNVIKVKLVEDLLNSLNFVKHSGCNMAYVEGICKEENQKYSLIPSTSKQSSHQSILIGDLKLSKFREILIQNSFKTEFKYGCLIVNGSILVNKTEDGQIDINGSASTDYFKVRQLLYSQFQSI